MFSELAAYGVYETVGGLRCVTMDDEVSKALIHCGGDRVGVP